MNKSKIVVLIIFVISLLVINIHNYFRKERLKATYSALIERSRVQLGINDAGESELESLPGIGRVLARRIIDYRDRIGRYESLEELKQVKGIGDKLYLKIIPYLKL